MLSRAKRLVYGDVVPPPLNRNGIEEALAAMRKVAVHFIGTDAGRALAECDRLLSGIEIVPEPRAERQSERGYRLHHLKTNVARYAECKSIRSFARSFRADADHYLKNRSKFNDPQTGLPRIDPWLSVARIIELCDGEAPSFDTIRRDIK